MECIKIIKKIVINIFPVFNRTKKIYKYYKKGRTLYKKRIKFLNIFYEDKIYKKYNCIISSKADIKDNIKFPHPIGIVIGEGVIIKNNVTIYQNVTLGRKDKDIAKYPIIEDDVIIYSNSVILGDVTIRKGTIIGANSVVMTDTEENSVYVGIPAKRVDKSKKENKNGKKENNY